jgi:hypothetical protein
VQQRPKRAQRGGPDRLLQVAQLLEAGAGVVVHRHLDAVLAHHQQALGAQRQLHVQAQVHSRSATTSPLKCSRRPRKYTP